jgi:hypothetical protein
MGSLNLGEADPGGLGACPQQNSTLSDILLFQKRSKSISSASQKTMGLPNLGEADPGGLGSPQKKTGFQEAEADARAFGGWVLDGVLLSLGIR